MAAAARWTTLPAIAGTWRVGARLTASPGTWTPPADSYEYRWGRCLGGEDGEECEPKEIAGATSPSYALTDQDEGTRPQVTVRAHNASGWSPWAESLLEHRDPVAGPSSGGGGGGGDDGTDPTTPGGTGTVAIRRLRVSPARFRAAARGATFSAARGTRVTVLLSARPAALRFRVERRSGTRWLARGGTLRVRPRSPEGTTVRRRFSGRISGRPLPAGAYRLRAVALDRAGRASAPATARFTIVR